MQHKKRCQFDVTFAMEWKFWATLGSFPKSCQTALKVHSLAQHDIRRTEAEDSMGEISRIAVKTSSDNLILTDSARRDSLIGGTLKRRYQGLREQTGDKNEQKRELCKKAEKREKNK